MKRSFLFALAIVLTACSTTPPQVTVTSEVTVTLPPTSPTPKPTATPEPAIDPEIIEAQEFFGDGFEITPEGKVIDKNLGKEIPSFTIVPFNEQTMIPPYKKEVSWGWQRVYEFEGKLDFTVVGTEGDIVVTESGGLDMYAWKYKDGEFTRKTEEFDTPNGSKKNIDVYNTYEFEHLVLNTGDSTRRNASDQNILDIAYAGMNVKSSRINGELRLFINPLGIRHEVSYYFRCWGDNRIPSIDSHGSFVSMETTTFAIYAVKDRTLAFASWIDMEGKPRTLLTQGRQGLDIQNIFDPRFSSLDP